MNKTDLINSLSEETTLSRKDIGRVLEAMKRIIVRVLKREGKVQWSGFGTFWTSRRAERPGINPLTKTPIRLPATVVAKFKAGKNLKELIKSIAK